MPLVTARRSGLVQQVIAQLRDSIAAGEWVVGQRIPNEALLCEQLGVGRNTVRESVRALAHAGILEVRQGDGTYVRATSEVSGALRRLCGTELRDILQVRRGLEVEGARLAAANRTSEDVANLRDLLARSQASLAEGAEEESARIDAEFHLAVVRCSNNPILVELYSGLLESVAASVATIAALVPTHVHTDLIESIAAGDEQGAAHAAGTMIDTMLADTARSTTHP